MKKIILSSIVMLSLVSSLNADYASNMKDKTMAEALANGCGVRLDSWIDISPQKRHKHLSIVNFLGNYKKYEKITEKRSIEAYLKLKLFVSRPDLEFYTGYIPSVKKSISEGFDIPDYLLNASYYDSILFNGENSKDSITAKIIGVFLCVNNKSNNEYYGHNAQVFKEFLVSISNGNFKHADELIDSLNWDWALYGLGVDPKEPLALKTFGVKEAIDYGYIYRNKQCEIFPRKYKRFFKDEVIKSKKDDILILVKESGNFNYMFKNTESCEKFRSQIK